MGSQYVLPEVKANLEELFPGLTLEEALQHQESLLQSLKISCGYQTSSNEHSSSHGHSAGESSFSGSGDYDLALDEALARSLQEVDLEEVEVHHVAISESLRTSSWNTEHAAAGTSLTDAHQDVIDPHQDIDPDNMTYEQRLAYEEERGSVKKGLTKSEIASLPSYTFKSGGGFFSKKVNTEVGDCVVCQHSFKNKDLVTSLPCAHQYHKKCIEPWLESHKTCPTCMKEVELH